MVRYRQTFIGAAWNVLQPLSLMVIFTLFFGVLGNFPSSGVPYPVFFLSGLVLWHFVNKVLGEGSSSILANAALVNRVYFPRAHFVVAALLAALVDLCFGLVALVAVILLFGLVPDAGVLLLPLAILVLSAATLGISFWLAALNAAYRDVTVLLPFLLQLWFFSSPIVYPSSIIPEEFLVFYYANPAALAIDVARWGLTGTPAPPLAGWILSSVATGIVLVSGYVFFRQREPILADLL